MPLRETVARVPGWTLKKHQGFMQPSVSWCISRKNTVKPPKVIQEPFKPYSFFWRNLYLLVIVWFYSTVHFTIFRNLSGGFSSSLIFTDTRWTEKLLILVTLSLYPLVNCLPQAQTRVLFFSCPSFGFCLTEPGNQAGKERRLFVREGREGSREDKNVSLIQDKILQCSYLIFFHCHT